ncbi:hypothetical protein [Deinococcus sp.]|uniref:hypothetical protein n=1 Tax=Deinococcus sp. TaxID=47478 RepID=UPI003B5A93D1
MQDFFLRTPSGQLVASRHIVTLDIQHIGVDDQQRSDVQASLVDGDKQVLTTFQGPNCRQAAQAYVDDLLSQLGAALFRSRQTAAH